MAFRTVEEKNDFLRPAKAGFATGKRFFYSVLRLHIISTQDGLYLLGVSLPIPLSFQDVCSSWQTLFASLKAELV
jgi:hypothetical protein